MVAGEPVEFEESPVQVQFKASGKLPICFRGLYRISLNLINKKPKDVELVGLGNTRI